MVTQIISVTSQAQIKQVITIPTDHSDLAITKVINSKMFEGIKTYPQFTLPAVVRVRACTSQAKHTLVAVVTQQRLAVRTTLSVRVSSWSF